MALLDDMMTGRAGSLGQTNAGGDEKEAKWLHNSPFGLAVWAMTPVTLHEVNQYGIANVDRAVAGLTKEVDAISLFRKTKGDELIRKLADTGGAAERNFAGIGGVDVGASSGGDVLVPTSGGSSRRSSGGVVATRG